MAPIMNHPAGLALGALLVWETLVRTGFSPLRWSGLPRDTGGPPRHAMRWLAGLVVLGTAVMAASLLGLCRPVIVLALAAVLAAAGHASPRPVLLRRPDTPTVVVLCCAAAVAALLPGVFSPALDQDVLLYHFGVPWQSLQTGRVPLEMVPFVYHHPLPADFANALPLLLGGDRLAKCQSLAALVAGLLVAGRGGGITAPLLLGVSFVPWLATSGKNDLASCALCLAGALEWRRRRSVTGALLLGAAAAVKLSCAPVAAVWFLAHPPRGRRFALTALSCGLPVLPWLVKAWLATGNPVFPLAWRLFPSPFWDARNQASMDVYDQWLHGAEHLVNIPVLWARELWSHDPGWLLALPVLALAGRGRSAAVLVAAGWGALHVGRMTRYMLPAEWLTALELGAVAQALPGDHGRRLRVALAAAALLRFGTLVLPAARDTPTAGNPYRALREAGAHLTARGDRRVLATGEWRTHLIPARILYDGHLGETPVVWSRVRAARSDDHLRRKFRQLGTRSILHNVVSVEWMAAHDEPFRWDDGMLRRYYAFCRDRTRPAVPPATADRTTGGYWILDLDPRPATPAPRSKPPAPFFLPGAEAAGLAANRAARTGRHGEAVAEYRRLLALAPGLGEYRSGIGRAHTVARRWREAREAFRPDAERGYLDGWNLWGLGAACFELGGLDEAETWFLRALDLYDTKDENRINLAAVYEARGRRRLAQGGVREARADLDRGERLLAGITPGTAAAWEPDRRSVANGLTGLRALLDGSGRSR